MHIRDPCCDFVLAPLRPPLLDLVLAFVAMASLRLRAPHNPHKTSRMSTHQQARRLIAWVHLLCDGYTGQTLQHEDLDRASVFAWRARLGNIARNEETELIFVLVRMHSSASLLGSGVPAADAPAAARGSVHALSGGEHPQVQTRLLRRVRQDEVMMSFGNRS